MRIVDVLYSLPFIFFVIMLVVFFGRNFVLMFLAVGAVLWLDMARIVRGQALSIKRQEYVQAAEALGVTRTGILLRHIVPNLLGPVVIYMTLLVPQVIILESFLSFLGLGVQEPMSSWGVLISQGAKNIPGANWLLFFPSFFLTIDAVCAELHRRRPARRARSEGPLTMAETILDLKDVRVRFSTLDGTVDAVKGVSLHVKAGETVAIVGESGSGKSQLMMAAMGLLASNGQAAGVADYRGTNLLGASQGELEHHSRPQDHHDLPGADDLARSALHDRRPADGADHASSEAGRRSGAGARHRDAEAGAHSRARAPHGLLSA